MSAQPPEGTQPAVIVATLSDEDVDRVAAATVTRLLNTKIKTADSPDGRYLRTVLAGVFNQLGRVVRKTGA